MRDYNYEENWTKLLTPQIVACLTQIHEYRGEQRVLLDRYQDTFTKLVDRSFMQSLECSCTIEGVRITRERLKIILQNNVVLISREEQEVAGYRDVLKLIHENNDYISVKPAYIMQLHRNLYKFLDMDLGGKVKKEKEESFDKLCEAYSNARSHTNADPLLVMSMFLYDFMYMEPFVDGNAKMSRLLALLLLYKADHLVGKYVSLESILEKKVDDIQDSFRKSRTSLDKGDIDYHPFVLSMLELILSSYEKLSQQTKQVDDKKMSKPNYIEELVKKHAGTITKTEILNQLIGISQTTIQRTLTELVKEEKIKKIGEGRYTKYIWNQSEKKVQED